MTDIEKWISLFRSVNPTVRLRAASAVVSRHDTPLAILLEILDQLSSDGLGARLQKALLKGREKGLLEAMIIRLVSDVPFIREVACSVLGGLGNRDALSWLLKRLNDENPMVRRAAAMAVASLGASQVGDQDT